MFTSVKNFLGNQKPPMLYINPEGEKFVVMGPDEYEHLTGESAESLQTIDPVRDGLLDGLNHVSLKNTVSNGVDSFDTLGNTNESLEEELLGSASAPEPQAVFGDSATELIAGFHATELAALRLEEEIGVDDLPL